MGIRHGCLGLMPMVCDIGSQVESSRSRLAEGMDTMSGGEAHFGMVHVDNEISVAL